MGTTRGDRYSAVAPAPRLELPRPRQNPLGASAADVVLPQLAEVPVAIEVFAKVLDLVGVQRNDGPEASGIIHGLCVLDEMNAVDQNPRHRLGNNNLPVRADERSLVGVEAARQRAAPLRRTDMTRIPMNGDSANPANRMILHRLQFHAFRQCERSRQVVMKMGNGLNIRTRTENLAMQKNLGRRPHVAGTRDDRPIEIADHEIVRPDRRAALLERLYKKFVMAGQPCRDMTAVAKDAKIVEQQSGSRDLMPEILLGFLHFTPVPSCCLELHRIVASTTNSPQAFFPDSCASPC